ncbi:hypothetical protein JWG39_11980 [Desulforhopalus vacuolatus]|nr:hypothetical protein [Desulforhopalus vacuolatus]MBM9520534.1 hypothetical protein [Desulforhopalus vacuolatus]
MPCLYNNRASRVAMRRAAFPKQGCNSTVALVSSIRIKDVTFIDDIA